MRNGKNQFYKKLKVSKETHKAIKLYQKFKYQVVRGFEYFDLSKVEDEGGEPR